MLINLETSTRESLKTDSTSTVVLTAFRKIV